MTEESNRNLRSEPALLAQQQATIDHLKQVVARLRQQLAAQHTVSETEEEVHLLDRLEQCQQIIRDNRDLKLLIGQFLEHLLTVFTSDRAWLAYPCNPDLPSWNVALEYCRPGYQGYLERAASYYPLAMQQDLAVYFRAALTVDTAVSYNSSSISQPPQELVDHYGIKAQLVLAIRPLTGKYWLLGIDQCSANRDWLDSEIRLFQQLGYRLESALSSLLSQEELNNREEQFGSLISNLPGTVYRYTIEHGGTPLYISDNIRQLCGYPAEDFLAGVIKFSDLCHQEDRQRIKEILHHALHEQEPYSLEYRIIDSLGHVRWVLEQGQSIHEENGTVKCFDGVIFDISDRKLINQELLQLQNLLSSTINAMPSILIGLNLQNQISQWNREAELITGISQQQALGKTIQEIFPQLPLSQQQLEMAMHSRRIVRQSRLSWQFRDQQRTIDIAIYPICAHQLAGAVIRVDDVTERVKMEEMMIQQDKILSIGGLAAGIAHEVNNPLSGILQNLLTMRNRLNENLPKNRQVASECGVHIEQINEYLERRELFQLLDASTDSAKRAADIITSMLNFSRMDQLDFHPQDLRQLLDATIDLAASSYNQHHQDNFRNIAIKREFADDLPLVPCQQSRIQQVFLNLLNNGAQAMLEHLQQWEASGKKSPDDQPCFILRLISAGERVRCEIEDNGLGMDENTRKRVFEPFFTTRSVGKGTGLGMAIGYFIICDQHRGSMSVESIPGVGTKFIIELPISQ